MLLIAFLACDTPEDAGDPIVYAFPDGFRWGAASAAHQIEGNNANNNWSLRNRRYSDCYSCTYIMACSCYKHFNRRNDQSNTYSC